MLHVIVPVHNRAAVTARFAADLSRQTGTDYTLVLVDDGCTDDTVEAVRRIIGPARLRVLSGDGQLWWAGALQMAYRHLLDARVPDDDTVLLINDDVSFEPDFLAVGLEVLAERPHAAIQAVGHDRLSGAVDTGAIADTVTMRFRAATPLEPANCLATRGLLMSAQVLKASGGFRPDRLPHYFSDYEFTLRLARQGVELVCDPRFRLWVQSDLTGSPRYRQDGLRAFWADAFSNRAKYNPVHASWFAILSARTWAVPLLLARIWLVFLVAAVRAAIGPRRTTSRTAG